MLKADFFDLYETLIKEFDPNWTPSASVADLLRLDATRFEEEWQARHKGRMVGLYPDFVSVLREICQVLGHPADETALHRLQEQRLVNKALPFVQVEGAVVEALRDIRRRGIKVGVISNCAPEEITAWADSSLPPYCDDAVFSCQVGAAKPDPAIYLLACRRLKAAPAQAIFVGDGGSAEPEGATQAGMEAYQATWFLDRWPAWRRAGSVYERAAHYPGLATLADLRALVARRGEPTGASQRGNAAT